MQGSVRSRGKGFQIAVYQGKDPVTGRSNYVREQVNGTEKDAWNRVAEITAQLAKGEYVEPSKLTFGEFLDQYLLSVKTTVSEGTYDDYYGIVHNHIKADLISKVKLDRLSPLLIDQYKIRKLSAERLDRRTGVLSAKTVKNHMGVIRGALKYACFIQVIKINPAQYVKNPKVPKYQAQTLTDDQSAKFLETAESDRFYLLFILTIYFGKRQGEIRGLRRQDIDLKNLTASIRQTIRKNGRRAIFKEPKTPTSISVLELESWMVPLFEEQFRRVAINRLAYGPGYEDHDLIFCSRTGRPVNLKVLDRHYRAILEKAKLPKIRFHDLRHTCASILLKRKVHPKLVQERLAHSTIKTTMDIYSHVIPKMQSKVNKEMNKALKIKPR